MAIEFLKELTTDTIKLAYNNNIVRFKTDSGIEPLNATITIGTNNIKLVPDPNGIFYYNFKELITTILNKDNFEDDVKFVFNILDVNTFVADWTDKISLTEDVVITINLSNNTTEADTRSITWLSGYAQLQDWKNVYPSSNLLTDGITLLQKKNEDSYFNFFVNYWYGYPFDLTVYGNNNEILILNKTNNTSNTFTFDKVSRFGFSDELADITLTLQTGINDLNFDDVFNIRLNKITDFCTDGIYIKWINSLGGWNYWLFSKGQTSTTTKETGSLNNDFYNLEDTTSPFISMGKTSESQIKIQQKRLSVQDKTLLTDLIDSAKVYLFTGVPFSQNTYTNWVEVNFKSGSFTVENPKSNMYQFDFILELPPNITRTL